MCVNDLVVQGAEPLLFLDYFATVRARRGRRGERDRGDRGGLPHGRRRRWLAARPPRCQASTARAITILPASRSARWSGMSFCRAPTSRAGDVILGLASSGVAFERLLAGAPCRRRCAGLAGRTPRPFAAATSLGAALLTPTRIYVRSCLAAIRETGRSEGARPHHRRRAGGEHSARAPAASCGGDRPRGRSPYPPVFRWLAGPVADPEMLRTFNCGIGMVLVVDAARLPAVFAPLLERRRRDRHAHRPDRAAPRQARLLSRASSISMAEARRRTAVLISGRGSNLAALIAAAKAEGLSGRDRAGRSPTIPMRPALRHARDAGYAVSGRRRAQLRDEGGLRGGARRRAPRRRRSTSSASPASCGSSRIEFVEAWRDRMLNIHPSLLPLFPASTHMSARSPPAFASTARRCISSAPRWIPARSSRKAPCRCSPDDTAETLAARVLTVEHRIYPLALKLVASGRAKVVGNGVVIDGEEACTRREPRRRRRTIARGA